MPIGTSVELELRTAATQAGLDSAAWVNYPASGVLVTNPNDRWVQYRATLDTTDSLLTPELQRVGIYYAFINQPPVAVDDGYTVDENQLLAVAAPGVLSNDSDPDLDPLTASLVSNVTNGTLNLYSDGSFDYTPDLNYHGSDSFTYKSNDGSADSNTALVTITVNPLNDPPVATPQTLVTDEDTPLAITLSGSDANSDPLTYTVVDPPTNGDLSGTAPDLVYTPHLNYNGPDSFTFKVNDGTVDSLSAAITLTINPVNDAPVAMPDAAETYTGIAVIIPVLANDTDVEGDALSIGQIASPPTHGTAEVTGTTITYTPDAGYSGPDSFTYTAWDGAAQSNTATVSITVTPDVIFADGFESGFTPWSRTVNTSGGLAITSAAARFGSLGLAVTMDGVDRSPRYVVDERPIAETTYHQRFYFDPNSISMANLDTHHFMKGVGASGEVLRMYLYFYNGSYYLVAQALDSSTGWRSTSAFPLSNASHYIEIEWLAAASGSLTLFVDGSQVRSIPAIANATFSLEEVWLGPYAGLDPGTIGTYFFDAFESRRASYIGIEGVTADFSAEPVTGFASLQVQFTSTVETMEPSVTYAWDFGDGIGSSDQANPLYTYVSPGDYSVSLTVTADGYQDVVLKSNFIQVLPLTDVIFADGFESGFTPWSRTVNTSGGLAITSAAARFGSLGLAVTMDGVDRSPRYVVDERPIAETTYHQRFYFDPNSISMANLDTHHFMKGVGASGEVLRMYLYFYNGSYYLVAQALDSSTGWRSTSAFPLSNASHYIEIEWLAAASGSLTLFVDGSQVRSIPAIANATFSLEEVWLGPYAGLDPGTIGTYFFDAFESRRASYIGIEGVTADFSAAPVTGFASLQVQFTSTVETMEPSVTYAWDFGDGIGSSDQANPLYTYVSPGDYSVSLTVTADGYQDVVLKSNFIQVLPLTDVIFADGFESGFTPWSRTVNTSGGLAIYLSCRPVRLPRAGRYHGRGRSLPTLCGR